MIDSALISLNLPLARAGFAADPYYRADLDVVGLAGESESLILRLSTAGEVELESDFGGANQGVCLRLYSGSQLVELTANPAVAVESAELFWLGNSAGQNYFALVNQDFSGVGLRALGRRLSGVQAGAAARALALANWHKRARFCGSCGLETRVVEAGWARRCSQCEWTEYPRQDPCIIVSVIDCQDRILLARNVAWKPGRVSVLAGYVDAAESLEQAVHREVFEEVGLRLCQVRYLGSQTWPFPRSLMMGFTARVDSLSQGSELRLQENEIAEAGFYSRSELASQMQRGSLSLPGPSSIARALIEFWYGGVLPD